MIEFNFKDFLLIVGIALIAVGVIVCLVQLRDADFDRAFGYSYGEYGALQKEASKAYIFSTVIATVSTFLVGLFFIALSKIIELLENLQKPQKDQQMPQKPAAPNRTLIVKRAARKQA